MMDCDVELENDYDCAEAYEIAWALAEGMGLMDVDGPEAA